jgi:hypothetical protein
MLERKKARQAITGLNLFLIGRIEETSAIMPESK